jgi:hypothetical protein
MTEVTLFNSKLYRYRIPVLEISNSQLNNGTTFICRDRLVVRTLRCGIRDSVVTQVRILVTAKYIVMEV